MMGVLKYMQCNRSFALIPLGAKIFGFHAIAPHDLLERLALQAAFSGRAGYIAVIAL